MTNIGYGRFRYWRKMIGFDKAYYKLKNEHNNPLQAIAIICAEQNASNTMRGGGEFLHHKSRRGY